MTAPRPTRSTANRQLICWQGWRVEVPARWNPIKLEGTFEQGQMLLADLVRPRLAIRWSTARKAARDPQAWARSTLVAELGQLAADEASAFAMPDPRWQASMLYLEPEPPARDMWVGFSPVSGRVLQVVHHVTRRDRVMSEVILPTVADEGDKPVRRWTALDLSCQTPAWMKLEKPLLYAGDLGLQFTGPQRQVLLIRQVAPAEIALKRMPLQHWLRRQQLAERKNYRPVKPLRALKHAPPTRDAERGEDAGGGETAAAGAAPRFDESEGPRLGYEPVRLATADGRELVGFRSVLPRRRRFFFKFMIQKQLVTYALHDAARDRLVIVQGGGEGVDLEAAAASVGWAADRT